MESSQDEIPRPLVIECPSTPPYNFGAADLVRNTYVLLFSYYFVITRTRYYYSSHFALLL